MQHVQQSYSANTPYVTHYGPAPQQAPQYVPEQVPRHAPPAPAPGPLEVAVWMVYVEGGEVVGPVSAQQIARGLRAGRVPTEASIQRNGEVFWVGLLDEPLIIAALKTL